MDLHTDAQMSSTRTGEPRQVLIELLRTALAPGGTQSFGYVVLYTSFGVVRGRTGIAFTHEEEDELAGGGRSDVIALNDVTVEHYSNHLASATFDRLYVILSDIQGFALVSNHGQG